MSAGDDHMTLKGIPPDPLGTAHTHPAPLPVGTILAYIGPQLPDGWLPCDGSEVDAARYPELHAWLYGAKVPDIPANFLFTEQGAYIIKATP